MHLGQVIWRIYSYIVMVHFVHRFIVVLSYFKVNMVIIIYPFHISPVPGAQDLAIMQCCTEGSLQKWTFSWKWLIVGVGSTVLNLFRRGLKLTKNQLSKTKMYLVVVSGCSAQFRKGRLPWPYLFISLVTFPSVAPSTVGQGCVKVHLFKKTPAMKYEKIDLNF